MMHVPGSAQTKWSTFQSRNPLFPRPNQMHKVVPSESFLNKAVRVGEQGVQLMGTLKGAWEAGRTVYGGMATAASYARPLLALM
jgi:hypothetical protein